jgi:cytochrome c oxidase subunit IV
MSAHDAESIRREVKTYIGVFIALAVLTVLTVAVSYFHMPVVLAIVVGLAIATFKGSLVAAFFMHLKSEKKVIYWVLLLTVVFWVALMVLPLAWQWDLRSQ